MKFVNACGDAKSEMDLCFREEKKLRKKLNKRVSPGLPSALGVTGGKGAAKAVEGGGAAASS